MPPADRKPTKLETVAGVVLERAKNQKPDQEPLLRRHAVQSHDNSRGWHRHLPNTYKRSQMRSPAAGHSSKSRTRSSCTTSSRQDILISPISSNGIEHLQQQLAVSVIEQRYCWHNRWTPKQLIHEGKAHNASLRSDWGKMCFIGRGTHGHDAATARYVHICQPVPAQRLARLVGKYWGLRYAVISVIGGGNDDELKLRSHLHDVFAIGLVAAARATNAVIMTNGAGKGLMQLVGSACAAADDMQTIPLLGFVSWNSVDKREVLADNAGSERPRRYPSRWLALQANPERRTHCSSWRRITITL